MQVVMQVTKCVEKRWLMGKIVIMPFGKEGRKLYSELSKNLKRTPNLGRKGKENVQVYI